MNSRTLKRRIGFGAAAATMIVPAIAAPAALAADTTLKEPGEGVIGREISIEDVRRTETSTSSGELRLSRAEEFTDAKLQLTESAFGRRQVVETSDLDAYVARGGSVVVVAKGSEVSEVTETEARLGSELLSESVAVRVVQDPTVTNRTGGIAFGVVTVADDCYNVTSPAGNWYQSCYKKSKDTADGNNDKDYWAYYRKVTSNPSNPWGVHSIEVESGESGSNSDHMERAFDVSPATSETVSSNCVNVTISIPLGSATASYGVPVLCETHKAIDKPAWLNETRYATTYSLGNGKNKPGAARTSAFAMGAKITQGRTPVWWDYSKSCWTNAGWGDSPPVVGCQTGH